MEGAEAESCSSDFIQDVIPGPIAEKLKKIISNNSSMWFMVVEAYDLGRKHAASEN